MSDSGNFEEVTSEMEEVVLARMREDTSANDTFTGTSLSRSFLTSTQTRGAKSTNKFTDIFRQHTARFGESTAEGTAPRQSEREISPKFKKSFRQVKSTRSITPQPGDNTRMNA